MHIYTSKEKSNVLKHQLIWPRSAAIKPQQQQQPETLQLPVFTEWQYRRFYTYSIFAATVGTPSSDLFELGPGIRSLSCSARSHWLEGGQLSNTSTALECTTESLNYEWKHHIVAWQQSSGWIKNKARSSKFALGKAAIFNAFVCLCLAVMLFVSPRPCASAHTYTEAGPVRAAELWLWFCLVSVSLPASWRVED